MSALIKIFWEDSTFSEKEKKTNQATSSAKTSDV